MKNNIYIKYGAVILIFAVFIPFIYFKTKYSSPTVFREDSIVLDKISTTKEKNDSIYKKVIDTLIDIK